MQEADRPTFGCYAEDLAVGESLAEEISLLVLIPYPAKPAGSSFYCAGSRCTRHGATDWWKLKRTLYLAREQEARRWLLRPAPLGRFLPCAVLEHSVFRMMYNPGAGTFSTSGTQTEIPSRS